MDADFYIDCFRSFFVVGLPESHKAVIAFEFHNEREQDRQIVIIVNMPSTTRYTLWHMERCIVGMV